MKDLIFELLKSHRYRSHYNDIKKINYQKKAFRAITKYAFTHSKFYNNYYRDHGITEHNIETVSPTEFPAVDKNIIMDNFNDVITQAGIVKNDVQQWIESNKSPKELYKGYSVTHTSGSSGDIGIYLHDMKTYIASTVNSWHYLPFKKVLQKKKIAFVGATHGLFSGVVIASRYPDIQFSKNMINVLRPTTEIIKTLNKFQPTHLSGYASVINTLANFQRENELNISPWIIVVSGESTTDEMINNITNAWPGAPLYNIYSTTETIFMGAQLTTKRAMEVFTNLNVIEAENTADNGLKKPLVTNLSNYIMPLIRYKLDDIFVPEKYMYDNIVSEIRTIKGRAMKPLPIINDMAEKDTINPYVLNDFFIPNVSRFQFISVSPKDIEIRYISQNDQSRAIIEKFHKILDYKKATKTMKCHTVKLDRIKPEPNGKLELVKIVR